MVDKDRIDRHVVVTKKDEVTKVSEADRSTLNDEEVLYNALGYSVYDLIRPTNLVFEGWRDKRLFLVALTKQNEASKFLQLKLKAEIGVTHAMGVKDIAKVVTYLDLIGRSSFVITDSDEVAVQKQATHVAAGGSAPWKRYDELSNQTAILTAEDFIDHEVLRQALVRVFDANGRSDAVPETLFDEGNSSVVDSAKSFLVATGIVGDAQKALLHTWKSEIFDDLSPLHIAPQYERVLEGIAANFGFVAKEATTIETPLATA